MASSKKDDYMFFILLKDIRSSLIRIHPGALCYVSNTDYNCERNRPKEPKHLRVTFMGNYEKENERMERVMMSDIEPLSSQRAALLHALEKDADRLKWFQDKTALKTAEGLAIDTPVIVDDFRRELQGIIRYIGPLKKPQIPDPISGTYFGIELQGKDKGKGPVDAGIFMSETLFQCEKYDGLFVQFSSIRPAVSAPWASSQTQSSPIMGKVVQYTDDQSQGLGVVIGMGKEGGEYMVYINTDTGDRTVPLNCVAIGPPEYQEPMDVPEASEASVDPQTWLGVSSMVELTIGEGCAHGVIRWIGKMHGKEDTMCGLELEEEKGAGDGMVNGKRYFTCAPNKCLFVRLAACRPDSRFSTHSSGKHGQNKSREAAGQEHESFEMRKAA
ncbi:hypothetical protein NHX12_033713 [Muraenolepis orangiensis]|uniref:ubiquitinyl hydrolase 1 n=1 Tax=Muraenolepis orangiensis TaxID=630683 RepID=A0A9Q0IGI7_9TELE|nr:hypothetical protein NHX12_033713 [Muraenolepis orangiensis]